MVLAHQRFHAMDPATFEVLAPNLFLPLGSALLFAVAYGFAILHRRTAALHARFMVATGLVMIDPVLGRLMGFYLPPFPYGWMYQAITFGLADAILVLMVWRPRLESEHRLKYLVGVLIFPLVHLAWFTLVQGPAWMPLARWFRDLPLT